MSWPEVVVEEWEHFVEIVSMSERANYPQRARYVFEPTYLWRGQANSEWSPEPRLTRILGRSLDEREALEIESKLLSHFSTRAHLFVDARVLPQELDLLSWWALMQHHGVPTRALDWTESAFVAAYFAVEEMWGSDGAVFMIAGLELFTQYEKEVSLADPQPRNITDLFLSETMPKAVMPWPAWRSSERLLAQRGRFTIGTRIGVSHGESILRALHKPSKTDTRDSLVKLVIPARLKPNFLYHLRQMNVTGAALFPGVDGIGRALSEQARLAAAVGDSSLDLDPPEAYRPPKETSKKPVVDE